MDPVGAVQAKTHLSSDAIEDTYRGAATTHGT